jgi:hypothetical protein
MKLEKIKKIGKWTAIIAGALITLLFIVGVTWVAMSIRTEQGSKNESGVYYIFGKGCRDSYNASEEELKKMIESELESVNKRRFKEMMVEFSEYNLKDLAKYNSKNSLTPEDVEDKNRIEKCLITKNRALHILNDLK